jgi:hypothetical protein
MHVVAAASSDPPAEEADEALMTPRGMAAPPAPRTTLRFEGDPTRPPTLRTEATGRVDLERRVHDERELDRVQAALAAEHGAFGHQLNWLLLSQGLLMNAFVMLLVFGAGAPLPGRRLLLGGFALAGVALAAFIYFALRGGSDATRALRKVRGELEARLQKDFGRVPLHAAQPGVLRGLGFAPARALAATFVAGWIALSVYALAVPAPAKPSEASRAAPAAMPTAPPARAPARNAPGTAAPGAQPAAPRETAEPQTPKRTSFRP